MRRLVPACWMLVAVSACQPTPKTTSTSEVASVPIAQDGRVLVTTSSDTARALYLKGRALFEQLQNGAGYALFRQAAALDSTFALAHYNLALAAPTAREAAAHLERALALAAHASDGERMLILAQQARVNADPARVRIYVDSIVTRYPEDERAHWARGNSHFARQEWDSAISEYQRTIAITPEYSLAYNSIGYAYRATADLASAERAFQQYIALVPNDPNPYDSYAELLMKMGKFDASIAQYEKALAIDPRFGGSHVGIAADHMYAGRYDAAIAQAQTYFDGARDDRERRNALFSQAMTRVAQGATDKALAAMKRLAGVAEATGDTTNMSAAEVVMGDIQLDAGRVDAARTAYQRAYDLGTSSSLSADVKQDNALALRYNMGRVALAQHDLATARTEAAAYLMGAEARHNDVRVRQAHELNGLLALEQRQFDASLAELALADQQETNVLYATAQAWRGKGDTTKANALVTRAVDMRELPTLSYIFIRSKAKLLASR